VNSSGKGQKRSVKKKYDSCCEKKNYFTGTGTYPYHLGFVTADRYRYLCTGSRIPDRILNSKNSTGTECISFRNAAVQNVMCNTGVVLCHLQWFQMLDPRLHGSSFDEDPCRRGSDPILDSDLDS
jgi:hypothetical protein